jgi:hypothetical protein
MDDFCVDSLYQSKNEFVSRLLTTLTPSVIDGINSIFNEAYLLCKDNEQEDKYLMSFQNFLCRIVKWNQNIIDVETKRIIEQTQCKYLEELITCVHIIQLKLITTMRVGSKQKKIDIDIPKINDFIHKTYINVARKIYKNVFLFENNIAPLQIQQNHREIEKIIQECILNTIRESIPLDQILSSYMDETVEEDVTEEIKEEYITVEPPKNTEENKEESKQQEEFKQEGGDNIVPTPITMVKSPVASPVVSPRMSPVNIPTIETETISPIKSTILNSNIHLDELNINKNDSTDNNTLTISDQNIHLGDIDVHNINNDNISLNLQPDYLDEIEVLE